MASLSHACCVTCPALLLEMVFLLLCWALVLPEHFTSAGFIVHALWKRLLPPD